jgi:transcriptional regulator with XRE-family HTH domain
MEIQTKEVRIILAIKAIRTSKKLSQHLVAKIYKVPLSTLSNRMAGRTYRPETKANGLKLTKLEEEVIVRNILNIDSRGFTPRLASVEDIANFILKSQRGETRR